LKVRLVALDLVATGRDALSDEIVLFDAVRIESGRTGARFRKYARPSQPLPLSVRKRCDISEDELQKQNTPSAVLKELLEFIGDLPILVYDIPDELNILSLHARGKLRNIIIDVEELARILLPREDNFRLDYIAHRLGIESVPEAGRAGTVAEIWLRLLDQMQNLSLAVVSQINLLLKQTSHPLRPFFEEAERYILRKSYGTGKTEIADVFRNYGSIVGKIPPAQPAEKITPLDEGEICDLFSEKGVFAQHLTSYEYRPEQIEMVRAVCRAFNNSSVLMVEAGTGTGKSMAYLVPAAYWAARNREKVIISTNTKNLQSQLFFKDIPFLQETLDVGFKASLIKGRKNYLCVRKFLYLMSEAERELDAEEIPALLPVVTWVDMTETGDIAENNGFLLHRFAGLWDRMSSGGDECLGRSCRYFRNCFVWKARALAHLSDIIIANHAVVFSELGIDSPILPEYRRIIFDEAHNVENVATEYLAVRVNQWSIMQVLRRLLRPRRDRQHKGLFANIAHQVNRARSGIHPDILTSIERTLSEATGEIRNLADANDGFFAAVANLFRDAKEGEEKIRYNADSMRGKTWEEIHRAKRDLLTSLSKFSSLLSALENPLDALKDILQFGREFLTELRSQNQKLLDIAEGIRFVTSASEQNYVFWAEMRGGEQPTYELCGAPLDISDLMVSNVYTKNETVVFCSATLTVNSRFDFMMDRLGLSKLPSEHVETIDVGSSFDFDEQTRVLIPSFLPDLARDEDFCKELADFLIDLLKVSKGRAMVLFTSYGMLNEVYSIVKPQLEREGILVLGQGKDGSRDSILSTFRREIASVLLGTQSFWEGVDVVGEALSLLVIVRLPFHVYTEPIFQARCELIESRGLNSFHNYTVPSAVIRFKQGFGRLIRTRTDRGVVIVTDTRVVNKTYGRAFLNSLPTTWRSISERDILLKEVASFLSGAPQPARSEG